MPRWTRCPSIGSEDDARPRATGLTTLAERIFGSNDDEAQTAVRGLLVLRGAGDYFQKWFPKCERIDAISLRVHTFFRSIEGLFAPADCEAGVASEFCSPDRTVGRLDVERDVKLERTAGKAAKRRLEILYCECCGDLFFGGRRPRQKFEDPELLPTDPNLDGLPDTAASQLFESLSYHDFAVFWPAGERQPIDFDGSRSGGSRSIWKPASLDPSTGQVRTRSVNSSIPDGLVNGFLFSRNDAQDRHKRKGNDPGTAVSYECPSCGEDYFFRDRPHRLSPLRSFRAGFAKTTQLLATELFDLLGLESPAGKPKLISFSDSRQDAANAALDIERRHHEDLRRQLLVRIAREHLAGRPSKESLDEKIAFLKSESSKALGNNEFDRLRELGEQLKVLQSRRREAPDPIVPLCEIMECTASAKSFQGKRHDRSSLKPFIRTFAKLGKGEKGTHVILFKPIKRTSFDETGEEKDDSFLVMRTFTVFNAEQTSGLNQYRVGFAQPKEDTGERYEQADAVIEATGADIRHGGNKAFYSLDGDYIQVPFQHQFESPEAFYETSFHELCHWTEKRVGFDRSKPENSYALGELIAEIGSCFLMGELGLPTTSDLTNHAAYLKNWLTGMNGDPKFIFRAAAQASKAVEFVTSFSRGRVAIVEPAGDEIPF